MMMLTVSFFVCSCAGPCLNMFHGIAPYRTRHVIISHCLGSPPVPPLMFARFERPRRQFWKVTAWNESTAFWWNPRALTVKLLRHQSVLIGICSTRWIELQILTWKKCWVLSLPLGINLIGVTRTRSSIQFAFMYLDRQVPLCNKVGVTSWMPWHAGVPGWKHTESRMKFGATFPPLRYLCSCRHSVSLVTTSYSVCIHTPLQSEADQFSVQPVSASCNATLHRAWKSQARRLQPV